MIGKRAIKVSAAPNSLEDELNRLCKLHGKAVVRDAAMRVTALRRGRRAEKDSAIFGPWLVDEARKWLEGRKQRSNYEIAQAFARQFPGHNETATFRRIQRKLSKSRDGFVRILAAQISESEYPHSIYLRALDELVKYEGANAWPSLRRSIWGDSVSRYNARFGEIEPNMTAIEIQNALKAPEPTVPFGLQYLIELGKSPKP